MVNARLKSCLAVLALGAAVLTGVAALRGAEYDEQYTMFLTGGVARPVWPAAPFAAGEVRALQAGHADLAAIARDLRATDVHPPLYFWAVALWRRLWGGGLFVARLFSVLCGVAALAAVAAVARRVGVSAVLATLLTLGCYGFAYTGGIARGFALAQALTLCGMAVLVRVDGRRRRMVLAGALLGAATFANYLAVFVASAAVAIPHRTPPLPSLGPLRGPNPQEEAESSAVAVGAMLPFLLADAWFFLAQRSSRAGQFPTFHLLAALLRLARYAVANLLGGLPLYVPAPAQRIVAAAVVALVLACAGLIAARWRHIAHTAGLRRLLLAVAIAPLAGPLLLGVVFRTTPIELRYLASATPFLALLLAGALASLPRHLRHASTVLLLSVQAAAVAGLMLRPETMQPARATAEAVARLADGGGVVLLPRGNDGVGIVGAFAIESPPAQRLLVVDAGDPPARVLARLGGARRVVLALLAQDDASRATLPLLHAVVAGPCWRQAGAGFNVVAFERVCAGGAP